VSALAAVLLARRIRTGRLHQRRRHCTPQAQSFVEAAFAKNSSLVAQYWLGLTRSGTAAISNFSSVWEPAKPLAANIYSDLPYYAHW
jgi:hypothetical protein